MCSKNWEEEEKREKVKIEDAVQMQSGEQFAIRLHEL
jgi:hypothetical protein